MESFRPVRFSAAVIGVILASVQALMAQPNVIVDEFGNGTVDGSPIPSQSAGGGLGLQYTLPYVVWPGAVVIHEGTLSGPISDVINFTNRFLFFASDSSDGADSPADVPTFVITGGPRVDLVEQGPEGNNFATYTPVSGQPGFDLTGSIGPNYTFISDVPEPSTCLLGMLVGGLLLAAQRRQRARLRQAVTMR